MLALKTPGELSEVLESPQGFFLVKLTARQPAIDHPFDEVKSQVSVRLSRERRSKNFETYVKKLVAEADIQVNDGELGKVEVPASPAIPPHGMPSQHPPLPPPFAGK